jgi:micrococcal nuclease
MKGVIVLLIAFAGSAFLVPADEITGRVVSVIDGNTIEIDSKESGLQKILFVGVDCPELEQEFGEEARIFLQKLILHKDVEVEFTGKDRSGNRLAIVRINDDDIRVKLLREGFAWTTEKNPDPSLEGYREWAEKKGKGLWKNLNPTAPWVFRRQQSMLQPKSS